MKRKSLFAVFAVGSWIAFSHAEEEALDGPNAAASIIEAGPTTPASAEEPETSSISESENSPPAEGEEEPSLDESEDTVPSGEDFFVVEPPSDMSAPDAPESETPETKV